MDHWRSFRSDLPMGNQARGAAGARGFSEGNGTVVLRGDTNALKLVEIFDNPSNPTNNAGKGV